MKASLILGAFASLATAFPASLLEELQYSPDLAELAARAAEVGDTLDKRQGSAEAATGIFEAIPTFDARRQLINVGPGSGREWRAPGPNDARGVCPGLNALANHGFLPRNGVATIAQYVQATTTVVGMGPDLALFLTVLGGLLASGDLVSWSMGGPPAPGTPRPGGLLSGVVGGVVGGLTGNQGNGLTGTHNKYENDVSPTRPDLYEVGNNFRTEATQFQDLIDASPGGIVTLDNLVAYRSQRFDRQIANNPRFFNAPFPGLLVQAAAFSFIFRFMANHTAEDPTGILSHETAASWFGIAGEDGSFTAPFGHERIPSNWYRRSLTAPYTIPYFLADTVNAAVLHPKFLSIGGNLNNQTNNFAGVQVEDLTGGLFRSVDLLTGNNLGCFAFQAASQIRSDLINVGALVNRLQSVVGSIVGQLGCPQLQRIEATQLEQFPGYQADPIYRAR